MPLPVPSQDDQFRRLVDIMEALLSEQGCPWDREQSHRTLRPYVVEEACEVVDAIDDGDDEELRHELGDLGLQIVFHAALARRRGAFDVDGVYRAICEKLIRRHPHVFGDTEVDGSGQVLRNWEAIKRAERTAKGEAERPVSALDGVPRALPGLQRASRLQDKARRVNFDWTDIRDVFAKVREEVEELEREAAAGDAADHSRVEDEFGDLLFALVNLGRFLKVDSEAAIQRTNAKFLRRFHHMEDALRAQGRQPAECTLEELDALWNKAKAAERAPAQ
ncbi:MAG: nucleoside triphosphate pyrophosphohydrolase [Candidatus Sumerlaeia bacterium]|nr:nucleoside triphosphate pyrophosphohydrolase [Candidatus Sumerlaeia bacterium]